MYVFVVIVGQEGAVYRAVDNLTKEEVALRVFHVSENQLKNIKVGMNG